MKIKTIAVLLFSMLTISIIYAKNNPLKKEYEFNKLFKLKFQVQLSYEKKALLRYITDVLIFNSKYLLIASRSDKKVKVFDLNGKYIQDIGENGSGPGEYRRANALVCDNNYIYIHDLDANKIIKYDKRFKFVSEFKIKPANTNMILDGNIIYISSGPFNSFNIYKYTTSGKLINEIAFSESSELAIQGDGLIQDENNNIYHFGKFSFRAKKLDNNFNMIKERILTEKNRSNEPDIKNRNHLECAYYFKNYLFVLCYEINPKLVRTILIYDTDLNYIGEINSLIGGISANQRCSNYFVTFVSPYIKRQNDLPNYKLNFYEFTGLNP
jgi:hypothetical protein